MSPARKNLAAAKTATVAKTAAAAVNGEPNQIGRNIPSQAGSFSGSSFIEALSYESGVFGKVLVGAQLVLCLLSLLPIFPLI